MRRFEGKVAIITGAASGIGAATLRRLASEGAAVVCADISDEAGESLVKEVVEAGGRALFQHCDVAELAQVEAVVATAVKEFGGLDIMHNNAAWSGGGWVADIDPEMWEKSIRIMLTAVFYGCRAAIPAMLARGGGSIVNTASIGGWAPDPNCAPYTTSKFAVVGYSEALRRDLEPKGIGVSILCPGPVATGMADADRLRPASAGESPATSQAAVPVMQVGMPPDDVGDLVIDGIRENATYIFTHPDFGAAFEPRIEEMRRALARAPTPRSGDVRPEDLA